MREYVYNVPWSWEGIDHSSAAQLLNRVIPDAGASALLPLGHGDFCLAFQHGGQIIRVARHAEAASAMHRETCILARIADHLPLPVPRLAFFVTPDCPPYTIHRAVTGEELTREHWEGLPAAAQDRIAGGLADFLLALHALPVEIGQECGLEAVSASALADALRRTTRETLWARLSADEQGRLGAFLAGEAARLDHSRPPALIHRDIARGHVLFDPEAGQLTGIIDFGDIAIGSPARDFIYIYEDFGPNLLGAVLNHYASDSAESLLRETRCWYLLEAAAWTLEMHAEGQSEAVEHGLAEMRRELAACKLR